MNEFLKSSILKNIAKIAFYSAKQNANTTCTAYHYQDKLPEMVKNLRKF